MREKIQRPLFRDLADTLTASRLYGSYILADSIRNKGPRFRSWKMAGAVSLLYLTDFLDGKAARYSNIPSQEGAWADESNDKEAYANIMRALAEATGDPRYIAYLKTNQIRDVPVNSSRDELRSRGIKADSRGLGKKKTATQVAAIVTDLSPIGDILPNVVHTLHTVSIGLTIASGVDTVRSANRAIQANDYERSIEPVDEVLILDLASTRVAFSRLLSQ